MYSFTQLISLLSVLIQLMSEKECVLSPDLFSLQSEKIMPNLEGYLGIKVGGHNINNLRYVGDSALSAENKEDLQL